MSDQTSTIPTSWKMTTLGEIADYINRGVPPSYSENGVFVINQKCIRNGLISYEEARITDPNKKNIPDDKYIKDGDILICSTGVGTLGRVGQIDKVLKKTTVDSHVSIVRIGNKGDKRFIGFLLRKSEREIELMAEGSTGQTELPRIKLNNFPIFLPSILEQKAISAILSSLDDKIELLREQNKTLETIAQTIFKEWFVNFNFPGSTGKMIDSELGEIPEGWKVGKLGEQIEIFDSRRIPLASDIRAKRKGKYPYYGATSIMDYIDDYLFDGTYLLLAEDGSVIDINGYPVMQYVWGQFWVSNHSHVLQGKNGFSTEILYTFMKKANVTGIVNGAVQLKINQTNLVNYDLIIPPAELLQKFDRLLQPIFSKVKNIDFQIKSLTRLRDVLLPKLMKGELRVVGFNNKP